MSAHWTTARTIRAPADRVFQTVADPEEFHRAIPDGVSVEYLGPARGAAGTTFRATRLVRGKPQTFEQEIVVFQPGKRVRMVNVTHGTRWEGEFLVEPDGTGATTRLTATMEAVTKRLAARMMMRLIHRMVQKALDKDLDAVKTYCERRVP
jgi:carbon monoxide dehydrogenase subunit G